MNFLVKLYWKIYRFFKPSKVVTGTRAKLFLDGKQVAQFDGVSFDFDIDESGELQVFGKFEPKDSSDDNS